jgi:hypothetical protein
METRMTASRESRNLDRKSIRKVTGSTANFGEIAQVRRERPAGHVDRRPAGLVAGARPKLGRDARSMTAAEARRCRSP